MPFLTQPVLAVPLFEASTGSPISALTSKPLCLLVPPPRLAPKCPSPKISDLIGDYLYTQIGAGKDDSPPNRQEIYTINLGIDLSDDTFFINSDCGNKGLRDGILIRLVGFIEDKNKSVVFSGYEEGER